MKTQLIIKIKKGYAPQVNKSLKKLFGANMVQYEGAMSAGGKLYTIYNFSDELYLNLKNQINTFISDVIISK